MNLILGMPLSGYLHVVPV